ncbi:MAG TPA: gliding motility-associated ABC transporter permease subunit GldF [Bacteroidia bacterium]|jgi:ABC-2 type transport system permease protein|nr:gliding motility-associated ABC transporter permease subunit GldF [Bacteroidia bacterium]
MLALLKKEISVFLSSLIGYIVICVFLVAIGLTMWVLPLDSNILNGGYAGIDPLFATAPWVFLFLIPAITMRSFAEEKRSGTIELLLTRPISDMQIVLAKFFASVLLVVLALIPTLVYYYSVYKLGNPPGNLDNGRTWGSYLGLIFLASGFVSIGIFASAITGNQVISFIVAIVLSFICYAGFAYLGDLVSSGNAGNFIQQLSISTHYSSMSRGVIDTRDVIYFVSISAIFLLMSRTSIESRKW